MNLDFSKIFGTPSNDVGHKTEVQANVQPLNELCACTHDKEDHEGDGDCTVLECSCTSYFPKSQEFDVNKVGDLSDAHWQSTDVMPPLSPEGEILNGVISEAQAKLIELLKEEVIPQPNKDITAASTDDGCAHLCKCGKWWSHGARMKCRHPDVLDMGLCMECLNGKPQADVTEDYVDGKLTPKGIQNCYNKALVDVANMNVEQVGYHIQHLEQRINELRAESIMSRKKLAEMIEEEVQKVDPAEREAFRQELLKGGVAKKTRAVKAKEAAPKGPNFEEISAAYTKLKLPAPDTKTIKLVAGLMAQMHKSAEFIVGYLND